MTAPNDVLAQLRARAEECEFLRLLAVADAAERLCGRVPDTWKDHEHDELRFTLAALGGSDR